MILMMVMTEMLRFLLTILMEITMTMIMKGHLKVLDSLLPITSKAVDDTRREAIHKPGIFIRILIFTMT